MIFSVLSFLQGLGREKRKEKEDALGGEAGGHGKNREIESSGPPYTAHFL